MVREPRLIFQLLSFLGVFAFLTSCRYSDNVSLNIVYDKGVSNFSDSTKNAYISTQGAYRSAEGLAAFPDGGQAKYVYRAKGLYLYDAENDELIYLKDLTKPAKSPWHVRLRPSLVFKDDRLYYNCTIDTLKSIDSLEFLEIKKVFVECFAINIKTKETSPIDTAIFNELYLKYKKGAISGMFRRAKAHPLTEWGLTLEEVYPKSDKQYIEYFISWENGGNAETRRAILEQIISNKSKDEIRDILKRMDKYKANLDGYERSSYEFGMEEYYEQFKKLLDE